MEQSDPRSSLRCFRVSSPLAGVNNATLTLLLSLCCSDLACLRAAITPHLTINHAAIASPFAAFSHFCLAATKAVGQGWVGNICVHCWQETCLCWRIEVKVLSYKTCHSACYMAYYIACHGYVTCMLCNIACYTTHVQPASLQSASIYQICYIVMMWSILQSSLTSASLNIQNVLYNLLHRMLYNMHAMLHNILVKLYSMV